MGVSRTYSNELTRDRESAGRPAGGSHPAGIPGARRPQRGRAPLGLPPSPADPESTTQLRTDARRNLEQVLRAAREVFGELGYDAPMEEIARRAGVGVGTIYRRFSGKESLVQRIMTTETGRLTNEAVAALAEEPDAWSALNRYLRRAVASGAGRLFPALSGRVPVTEEMRAGRAALNDAVCHLVDRAKAEGSLREDVSDADISLLLSCLLPPPGLPKAQRLTVAARYLEVVLDGLRADRPSPLPGKPFTQDELDTLFLRGGTR
ncbi:TetR/AcrR family transcriptional regulator [Yinghuangia seranimata]|uniref:TetR/AcrR family transcriptional regulator n=1 Tax=Yinghuangia seranimata TaxID=408067 RepID=UPI00248D215C|nr:TetR/AcrR family transcriptional regulator [Yinghuangia seranimata]MDI2132648.1 helix-turn-helix domain-containing protein [Yinghuangia seranimata]